MFKCNKLFLLNCCKYIDISPTESQCSKETSKAKPLHSNNELSADSQKFPSGNSIIETSDVSHFEDGRATEEVLEKENVTCNTVADKNSENLLSTNFILNKSVDIASVSEQKKTPLLTNKNNSEVSQICENVTFAITNYDQHKNYGEFELKQKDETVENETRLGVDFNFSPKDINISACPLCWKKIEIKTLLFSHMKSCASSHNVSTRQLLNALDLQNKQAAERKAIGLPAVPLHAPPRKNSSSRKVG